MIALFDDGGDVLVWNIEDKNLDNHKIVKKMILQECNDIILQGDLFIYNTGCFVCVMNVKSITKFTPQILSGGYLHSISKVATNLKRCVASTEDSILFSFRINTN